jgi:ADP-ribosylglycohydrolase
MASAKVTHAHPKAILGAVAAAVAAAEATLILAGYMRLATTWCPVRRRARVPGADGAAFSRRS